MFWNEIGTILLRTGISYALLVILMKFMGKREVGQLSLFDLLILLSIVDIMVLGIENFEKNFFFSLLPMIFLAIIQRLIALMVLYLPKLRRLLDGEETMIIKKGKLQIKAMKKQRYNMEDLLLQLRQKNIRSVDEVEYAFLETNGRLSVFTYEKNKEGIFPLPLIISGDINKNNLKIIEKGEEWLIKELKKLGINDTKNIFCAIYQNNVVQIIPYEND